ncbi:MAG: hypothetical protein QNJ29_05615 [Rhizobiaceae bacterium]|nr:hypothetical protein [Rhizobiaceae bacterium]
MKNLFLALGMALASLPGIGQAPAHAEITDCTEITTIPTVINASGIYCLKGNLGTNLAAGNIISIEANNVVIDLNGWRVGGLAGGDGTLATAFASVGRRNITIRNGTIRGFAAAISASGLNTAGHRYENLLIEGATSAGMIIDGAAHRIENNQFFDIGSSSVLQGASGIISGPQALSGSHIVGNSFASINETSTSNGIRLSSGGILNVIKDNTIANVFGPGTNVGILIGSMADTIIQGNRVMNPGVASGAAGISIGSSARMICADNIVDGYTTAIVGCNTLSNNITP